VSGKLPDDRRWQGWGEVVRVDARVVERCSYCSFTASGPLEQARAAFREHVCAGERTTLGSAGERDRDRAAPLRRVRPNAAAERERS
jgi:hypothetical protein